MATQEQENFYRHSTVIVDETKDSFLHLLEFSLTNQGITLHRFIETNGHEIYHMFSRYPCCQCPSYIRTAMGGSRVLQKQQLDILLDPGGEKLSGHNPRSKSAPHCCSPVSPNLQLQSLDFTLARLLLVSFTDIVPNGSDERNALDKLVNFRNESFAHAKEGRIPNDDYKKSMAEIEKSLLVLAKIYGKEADTKQRLRDIGKQPFNTTLCLQHQNTLLEQQNILLHQCQLDETIKRLLAEKSLPEYLSKDLEDIRVIEGCDAKLELWTRESGVNVEWFKGDIKIQQSNKFIIQSSCFMHSLIVTNADLTDRGIYYAKIMDSERTAKIDIEEYFTKNMAQTFDCIEGDNVELSCAVCEANIPAQWTKDGVVIQQSAKYTIKDMGKSHMLCIVQLDLQDVGNYSVTVNNRTRSSSIQVKEYFTKPLVSMTCMEGETVQFECEVLDDNQKAMWFKDGTKLSASDKYKLERYGQLHRIVITNAQCDDKGEYSVSIKCCVRRTELRVQEIEMPSAIQYLSEEEKTLYMDIIKTGTEIRYYLRIVIIGENGVGKTCLLRRLLKQSTTGVQSTDGIEIHRCKIRLGDGEWIFEEVSDKKELLTRIKMASHPRTTEDETLQLNNDNLIGIGLQGKDDTHDTSLKSSASQTKTRRDILDDDHVKSELEKKDQSSTTIPNLPLVFEMKLESDFLPKQNITMSKLNMEEIIQGIDDLLNGINKIDVPAEKFVECRISDFAGEKEYYATHPIFLNPNALHLLVANIMKDVKPITAEDGFDKIAGYIDFWLDTIHSCGVEEEIVEKTKTELYPPTIIVCTRTDECRDHFQEKKETFRQQLLTVLKDEAKKKHVREICYVSNTDADEEDFDILRKTIFKYGKQVKTFAETLPLRWIRLEQSLDILREEAKMNILSWRDIVELSSKLSIDNQDEINLFLKYQHKIGGVIYFESLKEYIILNQKWLANAFRCLVSVNFDSNVKLSDEWKTLEETGKLEHSLIVKLFDKEPELDFNKHSGHLLNVMEIFGIIVKLKIMENEQRQILPTYYLPCMITKKSSFTDIIAKFMANKDNCKRTPWLCIEFDFMPFDFFNHILCHYINQYAMCTEPHTGRMAIYHGMGVFFLHSTKSVKFILCFCKNTIALQIWQWKNVEKGKCKTMLEELGGTIERVKERFETRKVSYTVKSKCSDGNIHMSAGRHSYSELLDSGDDYFCEEHSDHHKTQDFYQTWFEDYTEKKDNLPAEKKLKGQKGIQDSRFKQKCHVCDKEPSVYWCHGCQRSMCQDCNNHHRKSTDTKYHIVQHVQDMYSLDYNFKVNVRGIWDIKVLHDDVLVIADYSGEQLVTCDITGQQQHTIPLPGRPWRIAVVDNNTVAVTLYNTLYYTTAVVIVDVRQRQVIQRIDVKVRCYGIMYRDNQLFVGCNDRTIKVMNMSLKVTRTIPVGVIPYYICGGEAGRIYYTDLDKLYCIDTVGNTLLTFTDPNMSEPCGITIDDEGHVLVICRQSNNVLRISPDGKQSQVIITQISPSDLYPYICYNSLSKSVAIGCHDNVYVCKKVYK